MGVPRQDVQEQQRGFEKIKYSAFNQCYLPLDQESYFYQVQLMSRLLRDDLRSGHAS